MARLRTLKPGFFLNESLAELTPHTRLCFAGLWTLADRRGILEDRPKRIDAELFPYETMNVVAMLDALESAGFIRRYATPDGRRALHIRAFAKHQTPPVRDGANDLPGPPWMTDSAEHSAEPDAEHSAEPGSSCLSACLGNGNLSSDSGSGSGKG